jgi:hypothetical protein
MSEFSEAEALVVPAEKKGEKKKKKTTSCILNHSNH